MQDKVGAKVPSENEIQKLVDELAAIESKIAAYTITLTSEERKATTKMRTGGEAVAETIGSLATDNTISLPEISVDGMKADFLLAKRLRPLANAATALSQRLDDTILQAQSEGWWAATAFYTTLARIAGASPKLESALKPVIDFFAVGRRKPKAP